MTLENQSISSPEGSAVSAHVVPTSKANARLLMDILIRGNGEVGPIRNVQLIAETTGLTVVIVKKRFAELGIEPITGSGESAMNHLVERESKVKKNNEDAPPLTHWDTLAPGQKAVVGAFFGHDGTAFDRVPRKDINTIASDRKTTYAAVYGLLQGALKKLRSIEKPTRKKRESKLSGTRVVKQKRVLIQSSIRPTHVAIPEEQTQTYEDLLVWLRMPENKSLVTSFEETVRLTKLKHSAYSPAQLAPKIIEKFREGFLGHAILSLAYYFKPETLVQDFIREIRPPVHAVPAAKPTPVSPRPVKKSEPTAPAALPISSSRTHTPPAKRPGNFTPLPTQPAVPTQVAHGPVCPTFEFKSDALNWLRGQQEYEGLIRKAAKEENDKGMNALFVKERGIGQLLLRILLKMKSDLDLQNIADIVHHVFPQEHKEISSPAIPPVVAVTSSEPAVEQANDSTLQNTTKPESIVTTDVSVPVEESSLQITPEHETTIRDIVQLHRDKKYREFWTRCQALADTHILAEIQEVKNAFQHRSILESIFFIAGQEITEKEKDIYRTHHWADRIATFPGVMSQLQRLLEHEDNKSMKVLKKFLEDVKLYVPLKREWQGLEEKELEQTEMKKKEREKENYREPNLFDVVVALVKTRKTYQKKDEESTKKLLRVVKQIMGKEKITSDDENIEDAE